jgi:hypothetical protein
MKMTTSLADCENVRYSLGAANWLAGDDPTAHRRRQETSSAQWRYRPSRSLPCSGLMFIRTRYLMLYTTDGVYSRRSANKNLAAPLTLTGMTICSIVVYFGD